MSFTVYKSSAGSGKTYTLVREYLKIAISSEREDHYRHILAITFTNKAANEMKERILKALVGLAENSTDIQDLKTTLGQDLGLKDEVIIYRASQILKHVLHNYADFSISTIDKFVHKVIRIFAFDLKLPLNFEVELDPTELLSKAIDELINKVGKEKELTDTLLKYTEEKAEAELSWHIENDIEHFAKSLLKEEHQNFINQLRNLSLGQFSVLRNEIRTLIKVFEDDFVALGEKGKAIIDNLDIPLSSLAHGKNGIVSYFNYWSNLRTDKLHPNSYVQKIVSQDKWTSAKATVSDKHKIDEVKSEIIAIYIETQEVLKDSLNQYIKLKLLYDNIYGLAVLNEIEKVLTEIKSENNILHISEFNKRIATIVLNEPAPFIYERIGERYSNYLIDEFQDTSELQWQNLLPLLDNSLASGNFNMVVGDGKQAIYRWRGGDVDQFAKLPYLPERFTKTSVVKEREQTLVRNHKAEFLKTNYRSKANVVHFNNEFFKKLSQKLDEVHHPIYKDIEQNALDSKTGGYVQIDVLKAAEKEFYEEKTLNLILSSIQNALNDGYLQKDIAILTRKNREAVLISDFLLSHQINVISSESLLVSSSFKVKLLVGVLTYLQDKTRIDAKLTILHYLYSSIEKDIGHEVLEQAVKNDEKFLSSVAAFGVEFEAAKLIGLPLFELLNKLVKLFAINPKEDSFVSQFFEFALKQIQKKAVDIYTFLEEWEKQKDKLSIALSEGVNAVSIMTIHKSKGLQFPVVIFPFASWKGGVKDKKHWVDVKQESLDILPVGLVNHKKILEQTEYSSLYTEENGKELLDNVNLLYVAFTRPEDRLYVICSDDKKSISKHFLPIIEEFEQWNAEEQVLSIGEEMKASSRSINNFKTTNLQGTLPAGFKEDKLMVSYQYDQYWEELDGVSGRSFGLLVHKILSKLILPITEKQLTEIIERETALFGSAQTSMIAYVLQLLSNKEVETVFEVKKGEEIYVERELLLNDGSVLRPDRVVIGDNYAVVYDFKTGDKQEKYKKQLNQYVNAMLNMGYEDVKSYILYTDSQELELV